MKSQIDVNATPEEKLQILLDRLDLANTIKNAGSRSKWAAHLKNEIFILKRRMASQVKNNIKMTEKFSTMQRSILDFVIRKQHQQSINDSLNTSDNNNQENINTTETSLLNHNPDSISSMSSDLNSNFSSY